MEDSRRREASHLRSKAATAYGKVLRAVDPSRNRCEPCPRALLIWCLRETMICMIGILLHGRHAR